MQIAGDHIAPTPFLRLLDQVTALRTGAPRPAVLDEIAPLNDAFARMLSAAGVGAAPDGAELGTLVKPPGTAAPDGFYRLGVMAARAQEGQFC